MAVSPSKPVRLWSGLALLAAWSGWLLAAFPALWPAAPAMALTPTQRQALRELTAQVPAAPGPLALRIASGCPCAPAEEAADHAAWAQLDASLVRAQGRALTLDPSAMPAGLPAGVVIFDGDGQPRYAGPLRPAAALCGEGPSTERLARWLPALLARNEPLLADAPACPC